MSLREQDLSNNNLQLDEPEMQNYETPQLVDSVEATTLPPNDFSEAMAQLNLPPTDFSSAVQQLQKTSGSENLHLPPLDKSEKDHDK